MFARTKPHFPSGEEAQGQLVEKKNNIRFNLIFWFLGQKIGQSEKRQMENSCWEIPTFMSVLRCYAIRPKKQRVFHTMDLPFTLKSVS